MAAALRSQWQRRTDGVGRRADRRRLGATTDGEVVAPSRRRCARPPAHRFALSCSRQPGPVSEYQLFTLPAHRRRVPLGQRRSPRRRGRRPGSSSPGRTQPDPSSRADLGRADGGQRRPSLLTAQPGPPAGCPTVRSGPRTRPARGGGPRRGRRAPPCGGCSVGLAVVHRHPAVVCVLVRPALRAGRAPIRCSVDNRNSTTVDSPTNPSHFLPWPNSRLPRSSELAFESSAPVRPSLLAVEGGDPFWPRRGGPAGTVLGDAVGLDPRDQLPALGHGQRVGARGLDDGHESRGTTNIVRRMHRVRTNVRRSYSASSAATVVAGWSGGRRRRGRPSPGRCRAGRPGHRPGS